MNFINKTISFKEYLDLFHNEYEIGLNEAVLPEVIMTDSHSKTLTFENIPGISNYDIIVDMLYRFPQTQFIKVPTEVHMNLWKCGFILYDNCQIPGHHVFNGPFGTVIIELVR